MTYLTKLKTGVCLAALVTGQAAAADVTAAEVWENWKDSLDIYGETGVTIASEEVSENEVVVTGLALEVSDPNSSVSAEMGDMTFTGNGDGTVTISAADTFPMTIIDETGTEIVISFSSTGLSVVASGTPDAINYAFEADQYALSVDEINGPNAEIRGDMRFTMNGVSGNSSTTSGPLRDLSYDVTVDNLDILFDVSETVGDGTFLMSGQIGGLYVDADLSLPEDMDTTPPEEFFTSGFSMAATYGLQSGAYIFDIVEGNDKVAGSVTTGATAVDVAFDTSAVKYDVSTQSIAVDMQVPELPFPINASLAEYGVTFAMPLARTDTPAPFNFGINLTELAINDEIWMLGDPGGQLSHDPVTLRIDLSGTAKLLYDLLDPAQADAIAMAEMPGEIYDLKLNELTVNAAGAAIDGSGGFTFDNNDLTTIPGVPRPEGSVTINIAGANALIDSLVGMGLLPEDQAMMGRMMMGMFARTTGDDQLSSTIEVNSQGHVLANGQRVR